MDLIDEGDPAQGNTPEFTVSDLSGAVKRMVEGEFGHVRVRGELGRVSRPRSGHVYLDLKDDRSVLSGVIWKGLAARLDTRPEEGMEVVATGRLTTFPGQSKYQIVIEDLRPAGAGALMAMLERRKAALAAEGLFDAGRKRPLPVLPEVIGVVTSPSGAVIRDILHRLRDRFPRKVLIWPVAVQGAASAPEIARAIAGFNALRSGGALPRPDLLIVARGGGSVEDLWGFNEEAVVRAAAQSTIPLISAVGHETDTTLIDFAADRRAPTPTAAAEMAVPVRLDLLSAVSDARTRMARATTQRLEMRRQRLRDLARALPRREALLDGPRQRTDILGDRLPAALVRVVDRRRLDLVDRAGSLRPGLLTRAIAAERRRVAIMGERLPIRLGRAVAETRARLTRLAASLSPRPLSRTVATERERAISLFGRLEAAGAAHLRAARTRLDALERLRETLGYERTLERGFAVVRGDGDVVTDTDAARRAGSLEIQFADGRLKLGGAARRKPAPRDEPDQGSLF